MGPETTQVPARGAQLGLNCFVLGDDPGRIFSIRILHSDMVSDLKRAIKQEKHALTDVDADALKLFKVSLPDDDQLNATLQSFRPQDDPDNGVHQLFSPMRRLEAVFEDPVEGHVHVIIWCPSARAHQQPNPSYSYVTKRAYDEEHRDPANPDYSTVPHRVVKRRRLGFLKGSETIYQSSSDGDQNLDLPSNADFNHLLMTPGILAADKTRYIEELDKSLQYQYMFLRPRQWGKSTFLQTLASYYDKNKAREFEEIFGDLYIGKQPTPSRNSLLVLLFDFSYIQTVEDFKKSFHQRLNGSLREFLVKNAKFLGYPDPDAFLTVDEFAESLQRVLTLVVEHGEKLFVGVDEYDAPANACMFSCDQEYRARFEQIADLFKAQFFAIMKRASGDVIQKYWLTGVLPAFRDGISPLAATTVISMLPQFHGLCGFTYDEVDAIVKRYLAATHDADNMKARMMTMKVWYNGYLFCSSGHGGIQLDRLFNPQRVFTYLRALSNVPWICPGKDVDAIPSSIVLAAVRGHSTSSDLLPLLRGDISVEIKYEFGPHEVRYFGQDLDLTWSMLFHLGVITHNEDNSRMRIPNTHVRCIMMERLMRYLRQHDNDFMQMTEHDGVFTEESFHSFFSHLERFLRNRPIRSIRDSKESVLQSVVELCMYGDGRCIAEMCLLVNPMQPKGQGRFNFADIFLASTTQKPSDRVAVIELKSVNIRALWKATRQNKADEPDHQALSDFRTVLKDESETQLLKRQYCYWDDDQRSWCVHEVEKVKSDACVQLDQYVRLIANGDADRSGGSGVGILDRRVRCTHGKSRLDSYIVLSIGDTRVLGWFMGTTDTLHTYTKLDT